MTTHRLKTLSPYFEALLDGRKPFEVRINDRNYQVGDELLLEHWSTVDPRTGGELGLVPGSKAVRATVTYVYHGRPLGDVSLRHGGRDIAPGYVVLGLQLYPERIVWGVQVGTGNVQHNTFS